MLDESDNVSVHAADENDECVEDVEETDGKPAKSLASTITKEGHRKFEHYRA